MPVRKIVVLTRHGSRTPCFPQDILDGLSFTSTKTEFSEKSKLVIEKRAFGDSEVPISKQDEDLKKLGTLNGGTYGYGQLTSKGEDDQYRVGLKLRQKYGEGPDALLKRIYEPNSILVRSTNVKRTIQSARHVLSGLFGEHTKGPIPIYVTSPEDEIIDSKLPLVKRRTVDLIKDSNNLPQMEDLISELTVSLGTQEKNLYYIVDNLVTLNDLVFPHLLDEETWQRLQSWKFKIYSLCILGKLEKRDEVLPILCGPLIDDILHQLEQPIKTSANMFYYSGHDATILRFLTALGVEMETVPSTSSTVVLEIHELENGIHAKVLYNWQEQIIRGASTSLVPFQHLVEVLSPFRMSLETFKQIQRKESRNE